MVTGGADRADRSSVWGFLDLTSFAIELGAGLAAPARGVTANEATAAEGLPLPPGADILTNFLPYDRASLEDAIDRFLDRIGGDVPGSDAAGGRSELVTDVVALAVALTASKGFVRIFGRTRDDDADPDDADPGEDFEGWTGLPYPWGRGEA
jgi:hypothetical protein